MNSLSTIKVRTATSCSSSGRMEMCETRCFYSFFILGYMEGTLLAQAACRKMLRNSRSLRSCGCCPSDIQRHFLQNSTWYMRTKSLDLVDAFHYATHSMVADCIVMYTMAWPRVDRAVAAWAVLEPRTIRVVHAVKQECLESYWLCPSVPRFHLFALTWARLGLCEPGYRCVWLLVLL